VSGGPVWLGPIDGDPFAAFGPGTTKGGRAEAGWFEIGTIVGDTPKILAVPHGDAKKVQTVDARYTCAQNQVDANPDPEPRP
jgi:hypothetical protein